MSEFRLDLLPCPFCGESRIYLNPREGKHRGSINCPACLAAVPEEAGEVEMIEAWNGRASVWKPIATAPKDGTEVLLFTTHQADDYCDEEFSAVQIGSWDHGNEHSDPMWRRAPGWECSKIGEPSHWMPLPQPPIETTPHRAAGG